ncbi:MAG: hypothetical protein IT365_04965 [Candidatus Hydrogenedentes bacterium]|nr:hypothetical protein [Candidatus Hydrogenedentota bacterium]
MKTSSRIVYYSFGSVTALFVCSGGLFLATALFSGHSIWQLNDADAPYVAQFFIAFSSLDAIFLTLLAAAVYLLFRKRASGFVLLSATLLAEVVYFVLVAMLWLVPNTVGMSAASASGIGNMGIAPQMLVHYPIPAIIAMLVLKALGILELEWPSATSGAAPGD